MEQLDHRLVAALREASGDLKIALVAPFATALRSGEAVSVEGYFPDFGDYRGVAFVSFARRLKPGSLAVPMVILPKEYRKYWRKRFVEALRDCGWSGEGNPPNWLDGS